MARSISNVRLFSAYYSNGIAKAVPRRGYAAAVKEAPRGEAAVSKAAEGRSDGTLKMRSSEEEMTWMPDPKTGFYRPGTCRDEIDAAELRALMLKKKDSCTTASQ